MTNRTRLFHSTILAAGLILCSTASHNARADWRDRWCQVFGAAP